MYYYFYLVLDYKPALTLKREVNVIHKKIAVQFSASTNGLLQESSHHLETEDQKAVSPFYNGVNGI